MNAFESGQRKVIPAVLIYGRCGDQVLMLHRNSPDRPDDYHAGKWNGLGGKCEPDESPGDAARREFREECGVELPLDAFHPLGVLQFPNFKPHKAEDWICFVYEAEMPSHYVGAKLQGPEGELHWVRSTELISLNLWAGDRYFMPFVVNKQPFSGTIWYSGQEVIRHEIRPF